MTGIDHHPHHPHKQDAVTALESNHFYPACFWIGVRILESMLNNHNFSTHTMKMPAQHDRWLQWAAEHRRPTKTRRRDLLSDKVDRRAEQHMRLPTTVSLLPQHSSHKHVMKEESLSQSPKATKRPKKQLPVIPPADGIVYFDSDIVDQQDEPISFEQPVQSMYIENLRLSPTLIEQQELIWQQIQKDKTPAAGRARQPVPTEVPSGDNAYVFGGQRVKIVPQSRVQEAYRSGKAVTLTCVGCEKKLLATPEMTMVFCPVCGTLSSSELCG